MRPVVLATPAYGGTFFANYVESIIDLPRWVDFYFVKGRALITQARNECVAHFMSGDWEHLFFVDADIGFPVCDFIRLLKSGYDVAVSPYPFKGDGELPQGGFAVCSTELGPIGEDGFGTIQHGATGFMCIKRRVFEKMALAGIHRNEFFDTMRDGDDYICEDHAFCRRWLALGGSIHLDTRAHLTHAGTKIFSRDFIEHISDARS